MKSKYRQRYDNEEYEIPLSREKYSKSGYLAEREWEMNVACCDCGLVHNYKWIWRRGRLFQIPKRDRRRTSAYRRYHPVELK